MVEGFVTSDVGDSISLASIPKYVATENTTDRIAIMQPKKGSVKLHSIKEFGGRYVYCWGGGCCKRYGNPQIKYVYSIIQYPTDKKGNIIPGTPEVKRLVLTDKKDKVIRTLSEVLSNVGKKISDIDLLMIGGVVQTIENKENPNVKPNEYVDFSIMNAGTDASWKKHKEWIENLKTEYDYYKEHIEEATAMKIENDEEFYKLIENKNNIPTKQSNFVDNSTAQKAIPDNSSIVVEEDSNLEDFFPSEEVQQPVNTPVNIVKEDKKDEFDMFD
jgi:hypothetical protein